MVPANWIMNKIVVTENMNDVWMVRLLTDGQMARESVKTHTLNDLAGNGPFDNLLRPKNINSMKNTLIYIQNIVQNTWANFLSIVRFDNKCLKGEKT